MSPAPKVRKFGAPKPPLPPEIARLIAKEQKRIEQLERERKRIARRLVNARAAYAALMRVGNQLAAASLDGAE